MFPKASMDEAFFGRFGVRSVMVFLAIVSIIYGALAAMYFVVKKDGDVKKLVAYSSVSSMGIVMLGLFALNPNGINGAVMQMINHGIYSGALFLLVGIIYERRHTRNVAEFGGLSHVMPGYAAVFLAMAMTAIGLPLLAVFISEFLAMRGAFEANPWWAGWAGLGIILNAGYMLWLYQRMFFGEITNEKNKLLPDLSAREWAYMLPLVIMSLWIGMYPAPFIQSGRLRRILPFLLRWQIFTGPLCICLCIFITHINHRKILFTFFNTTFYPMLQKVNRINWFISGGIQKLFELHIGYRMFIHKEWLHWNNVIHEQFRVRNEFISMTLRKSEIS